MSKHLIPSVLLAAVGLVPQLAWGDSAPPPPGLVAWWPGAGTLDEIAGANDGIAHSSLADTAAGMVGQAFSPNGTDSYIEVPDAPRLNPRSGRQSAPKGQAAPPVPALASPNAIIAGGVPGNAPASQAQAKAKVDLQSVDGRSTALSLIAKRFDGSPKRYTPDQARAMMKKHGAMGLNGGGVNEPMVRADFDKGLPYLSGKTGTPASLQKAELFKRQGISIKEFHDFLKEHGGAQAYIDFIKAHEIGHEESGHLRNPGTPNRGLMSEESLSREIKANEWALKNSGFYEWRAARVAKTPTKARLK